jgi:hypothetical protein
MATLGRKRPGVQGARDQFQALVVVHDERKVVLLVDETPTRDLAQCLALGMLHIVSGSKVYLSFMTQADPTRKKPPDLGPVRLLKGNKIEPGTGLDMDAELSEEEDELDTASPNKDKMASMATSPAEDRQAQ